MRCNNVLSGKYLHSPPTMIKQAAHSFQMLIYTDETARCHTLDASNLQNLAKSTCVSVALNMAAFVQGNTKQKVVQ